jgi:hypothetical protein
MIHVRVVSRIFFALHVALAACDADVVTPDDVDESLRTAVVPDASWATMERDLFTYRIPPGFQDLHLQPIDSDAVMFASGGSTLHHDYGMYTGPFSLDQHAGAADVVEQQVKIGGRTAQVVGYREGAVYVVRASWKLEREGQQTYLLIEGRTEELSVRAQLLAAIYSAEFF